MADHDKGMEVRRLIVTATTYENGDIITQVEGENFDTNGDLFEMCLFGLVHAATEKGWPLDMMDAMMGQLHKRVVSKIAEFREEPPESFPSFGSQD